MQVNMNKVVINSLQFCERLWRRSRRLCSWLILSGSRWLGTWWLAICTQLHKTSFLAHIHYKKLAAWGYTYPQAANFL